MRYLLIFLFLSVCCLLAGCGGGNGPSLPNIQPATLTGRWLESSTNNIAGTRSTSDQPHPTRVLELKGDGTFHVEDSAPENWVAGQYQVAGSVLQFTCSSSQGESTFPQEQFTIINVTNTHLAVKISSARSTRLSTFSRLCDTPPSGLSGDWLMVIRMSAKKEQLPCPTSMRWSFTSSGTANCSFFDPMANHRGNSSGLLLTAIDGQLAVRLDASGGDTGHLYLLGGYQIMNGMLVFTSPETINTYCAPRISTDSQLVKRWVQQSASTPAALELRGDGSYLLTTGATTDAGNWEMYRGGYLCLHSDSTQHTFAWALDQSSTTCMNLCEWKINASQQPEYQLSSWRQEN